MDLFGTYSGYCEIALHAIKRGIFGWFVCRIVCMVMKPVRFDRAYGNGGSVPLFIQTLCSLMPTNKLVLVTEFPILWASSKPLKARYRWSLSQVEGFLGRNWILRSNGWKVCQTKKGSFRTYLFDQFNPRMINTNSFRITCCCEYLENLWLYLLVICARRTLVIIKLIKHS